MSAAHSYAVTPRLAAAAHPDAFAAFCARHGLPAHELPTRALALAVQAFGLLPRYVGHSEPLLAMAGAYAECEGRRAGLMAEARAVVACERLTGRVS